MARIPDKDIQRLKSEVSLQRLVETHGIELKKHGQDYIGLCPFHDDKEPSLVISPKNNLWHCLGACQTGGSVIDWMMQIEGVSFRHAVELLQNDHFTVVEPSSKPVKRSTTKKLATHFESDTDDQLLLNQVVEYYHQTLLQSPEAIDYLARRGITDMKPLPRSNSALRIVPWDIDYLPVIARPGVNFAASYKGSVYTAAPATSTLVARW